MRLGILVGLLGIRTIHFGWPTSRGDAVMSYSNLHKFSFHESKYGESSATNRSMSVSASKSTCMTLCCSVRCVVYGFGEV